MLLERDSFLDELYTVRDRAAAGEGCVVLVSGEAGIGKTTVVEQFLARIAERRERGRLLWGSCDALITPRPLAPLLDMARQSTGPLREAIRSRADRERLFAALLDELSRPPGPTVAVVEDVHWADEATLDLLKFVSRRIRRIPALLVLTFRDDEVDTAHPLQRLLGELPPASVRRLRLPPLSESAVARLAGGSRHAAAALHGATGGNPFYVTEVLATSGSEIPRSIRDAVLARAAVLDASTRALIDVVSVIPGPAERWLLEAILEEPAQAVAEAGRAGLLRATGDAVAFRHELARQAWESSIEPAAAAALHARILATLQGRPDADGRLPRLVHHAERCAAADTVLRLAPLAAREAAALGAHREAAAHYASALRYATGSAPEVLAALLDAWSYEAHLGGRIVEAVGAQEQARALWRQVGERRREGDALRVLSRLAWFEGRRDDATAFAAEAIRVLEPLGPGHELAMAYSARAQLHILAEERHLAPHWGDRAVAMAEALDDPEALVHALTNAACLEPGASRQMQVRAARLAQQHGMHEHAMRAFTWLISDAITEQDYQLAERFLEEALEYGEARDLDAFVGYLRGWRARMHFEQGRLADAEIEAADVLRREHVAVVRLPALITLAALRTRRGDADAGQTLDEALALALSTGELQRIAPVACARAEAAWLRGDAEAVRAEVTRAYPAALEAASRWDAARLAAWLRRADALGEPPPDPPGPLAAELVGRWRDAAEAWEKLGCPYEQALVLAEGDESAQRQALAILDRLGARPAAALVRARLRRRGVRGLPRGPRPSTRANPAGLTSRETEVLALLAEGQSNREIGRRLSLSTRTVDHHVSALLRKLGVTTRTRAARRARELGLVSGS